MYNLGESAPGIIQSMIVMFIKQGVKPPPLSGKKE
jgi:hypothetical protein